MRRPAAADSIIKFVILYSFSLFWQWNNFENRLIFGKVKAYKMVPIFGLPCTVNKVVQRPPLGSWIYDHLWSRGVIGQVTILLAISCRWWSIIPLTRMEVEILRVKSLAKNVLIKKHWSPVLYFADPNKIGIVAFFNAGSIATVETHRWAINCHNPSKEMVKN